MNNSSKSALTHLCVLRSTCVPWIVPLVLLALPAAVQAQFNYTTNVGSITITGYTGPGGDVAIPDTINGLPVTSIGQGAFASCTSLTNVTIPESVTCIGDYAFWNCTRLTTITIPNSVTTIGGWGFESCTSLTTVMIPNGVTSIGVAAFAWCSSLTSVTIGFGVTNILDGAFADCLSLTAITVDTNSPAYSSVDGALFNKNKTTLVQYPGGVTGSYTIPNSVANIGDDAFDYCTSLTNVTMPDSLTNIGVYAFESCTGLTSVVIPSRVTSIGGEAFGGCTSLTSVTIPSSVTSIGEFAFDLCKSLTSVTILYGVTNIGEWVFSVCTGLTSISIPNSVINIGVGAFNSCTSLTNVTIGTNVASLGDYAFYGCSGLSSVTLPNGVTSIGQDAFASCTSLTNVTISDSVTDFGYGAFKDCSSLTSVFFLGNAPYAPIYYFTNAFGLASEIFLFSGDNCITYFLPGTTGWGATYGGRPTALWVQVPTVQTPPQTQMAEAGAAVSLWVDASSPLPLFYLWRLDDTNLMSWSTNCELELTSVQFTQSGAYTVVVSNVLGAVTSAPALLKVIAPVQRRPVPGVQVTGESGSLFNVDYASSLGSAPVWTSLGSVSLTSTSRYYFDLTLPLPPQRFYRAWQTGTPGVRPSLDVHPVPAITLTGNIGGSVRVDYINQFGPIDAWVTLDTVTLTNTSQLYFDTSAWRQPLRLYRLVQVP